MKLLKREDGAALVEFALVISLLFLIIFGIIEFGRIFNAQITVTHAAREGARIGVITPEASRNDAIRSTVINRAAGITLTNADIVIIPEPADDDNQDLKVTVNYKVDLLAPMIAAIIDNDDDNKFPVHGEAIMRLE